MMHYFRPFILLLSLLCFAPGSFAQKEIQEEYRAKAFQYYALTNKAELAICDNNIALAHQYYIDAFRINPEKPFSVDLLNAFKCAMDLHLLADAEISLHKLMTRGVGPQLVESLFDDYKGADSVFIVKTLKKYPNLLWKLEHEINIQSAELLYTDQEIRKHEGATRPKGNYMTDTVYAVDAANAWTLRQLFDKYGGIPNEDIIGNHFGGPSFTTLMGHHKGGAFGKSPSHYFDTMLLSALLTYDISPAFVVKMFSKGDSHFFLPWASNEVVQMPISLFYGHYNDQYDSQFFEKEKEIRMDYGRAKIGLCSIEEMRRKEDYMIAQRKQYGKSKYTMESSVIGYLESDDAEEYEKWKKREVYRYKR